MSYLLSKWLDPAVAIFTGSLAFYLSETNPRTMPEKGETLRELMSWKRELRQKAAQEREAAEAQEFLAGASKKD
ncbi:hypothetical protein SISNIDRAFT_456990 [Sistotremastrum niveocremeum HHB9708]|uniref:Uncharacterized protein n=1 Tax=Sistotremastrum niveocremeum HHB9708 TaxID=1314777 RepID=A0A164RZ41_9AGAM|nr:hypothetical protein SISNIDRAFT_456990 [Sistotremastrum niveocremeum HHB9708]